MALVAATLVLPIGASARQGQHERHGYDIEIGLDFLITAPDSAAGPWELTLRRPYSQRVIRDSGQGGKVWDANLDGTMTLYGEHGTLTIAFEAEITSWTGPATATVGGTWTLVEGTGRYAGLHASGEINATIAEGTLVAVYSGTAIQGRATPPGR